MTLFENVFTTEETPTLKLKQRKTNAFKRHLYITLQSIRIYTYFSAYSS